MLLRVLFASLALGLLTLSGSSAFARENFAISSGESKADPKTVKEVSGLIKKQETAWNKGDLKAFLSAYSRAKDVTYVSSNGLCRGFDAIEKRYQMRYGNNRATMGQLYLTDLEVSSLGEKHALCIGKFSVVHHSHSPINGRFTLIFRRSKEGWRITYDHSSI
ncbi:MAG: nuclear transport factor 2 family protein [Candidatus Melainabacteria bacterium]|jgi:beta-aspartyl-peptidase (threonine type)|nr:nuclear transport factor 2 family protein [Candidatus Melainabacteria bacterium]